MSALSAFSRLRAMDRDELRFRIESETRKVIGRARHSIAVPRWRRTSIASLFTPSSSADIAAAHAAARRHDYSAAHRAIAQHLANRRSVWPIAGRRRAALTSAIRSCFPHAAEEAARDGDALVQGRHNLLGYRGVACGSPPDWHRDPIASRRAPAAFWAAVSYLDPAYGDHKVIWELNRHQHWRSFGRAFWLTGDTKYRDAFVRELSTWLAANPPETGVNWASMLELGFRTLSWTWAVEYFAAGADADSSPWLVDLFVALDRQLAHIEHNLSYYFSPNTHLTGEALALYAVSSAFPELRRSAARADLGRQILLREIERQIKQDGGHAELSAHYHRYSTDFYLLALMVARSSGDPAAERFENAARAQASYLRTLADDRGRLPLIGDDDGGQLFGTCGTRPIDASPTLAAAAALLGDVRLAVTPASEEVFWIVGQAPTTSLTAHTSSEWPSRLLASSGYFVSRSAGGHHLVFDAGPHGFLNGGHAHSDALSVVLTIAGDEVFVDPGTATYTMDAAARDRFRSTRMHNTVVIDGRDHARPRGPFHWHERPTARMLSAKTAPAWDFAQGTHDAYGDGVHVRSLFALHGFGWIVIDQIVGTGKITARAWWHLHPRWQPSVEPGRVVLDDGDRQLAMALTAENVTTLHGRAFAEFAPEYGRIEPAPTICVTETAAAPFAMAAFIPAGAVREVRIAAVALEKPLHDAWVGAAFEVQADGDVVSVLVASPRQASPLTAPAVTWGTSTVETDARALAIRHRRDRAEELAVIDGRVVTLRQALASAVHATSGAGAAVSMGAAPGER